MKKFKKKKQKNSLVINSKTIKMIYDFYRQKQMISIEIMIKLIYQHLKQSLLDENFYNTAVAVTKLYLE